MKALLSGGNFGGLEIEWPPKIKQASIYDNKVYWNYDIDINKDDLARADFIGCSSSSLYTILTII